MINTQKLKSKSKSKLKLSFSNISLWINFISFTLIIIGYITHNKIIKTIGLYAFSGAITNWLAIIMLFEKIPFDMWQHTRLM